MPEASRLEACINFESQRGVDFSPGYRPGRHHDAIGHLGEVLPKSPMA
jgi:hypothetical protein